MTSEKIKEGREKKNWTRQLEHAYIILCLLADTLGIFYCSTSLSTIVYSLLPFANTLLACIRGRYLLSSRDMTRPIWWWWWWTKPCCLFSLTFCGSWWTSPKSGGCCRGAGVTDNVEDDELEDALPNAFSLFRSTLLYALSLLQYLSAGAPAGCGRCSSPSSSTSHVRRRIRSASEVVSCWG